MRFVDIDVYVNTGEYLKVASRPEPAPPATALIRSDAAVTVPGVPRESILVR
jgi:hypothetical protein